jgi:hypothetical protein
MRAVPAAGVRNITPSRVGIKYLKNQATLVGGASLAAVAGLRIWLVERYKQPEYDKSDRNQYD